MKKLIALVLALCIIAAFAGCSKKTEAPTTAPTTEAPTTEAATTVATEVPAEPEGTVMTHADYVAAELESPVYVETYVQATQSWWENKITVYAQSEDGAYFLYNMECTEDDAARLVPGTRIRVNGYKAEWSGEVEIVDATFEILDGSYIAEAKDVTALLGTDELAAHQNEKVSFKGLTVEAANDAGDAFLYNWDGSGEAGNNNDLYFNVSDGTNTYTFTVESYLCGEGTDVYTAVTNLKVGDTIDVEGFLYWYNGAQPHVTSVTVKYFVICFMKKLPLSEAVFFWGGYL